MKIRQAIAVFLTFLFLGTKIGAAFNVHYCRGEVVSVSHVFETAKGCGMDEKSPFTNPCKETLNKPACCDDDVIVIQNNDRSQKLIEVDTCQVFDNPDVFIFSTYLLSNLFEQEATNAFSTYDNDVGKITLLFKLYCALITYG